MVNWSTIITPAQLLAVPNTNTGGSFWSIVVYLVWVVLILAFLPFNIEVALLASSFIALIASILLVYMGLIAWPTVLFFVAFILFMFLYIVWSSRHSIS